MASAGVNRRSVLRSSCAMCTLGFHWLANAQDQPDASSRIARPTIESDEGGLWAIMEREEKKLRRSPLLINDEKLKTYLSDLACKLGGEHCPDIRVYPMRTPLFNASMAPNGMIQIWSGLMLRVENEAQLSSVIGHEIGHYVGKHSLLMLRSIKDKSALATFMFVLGPIGLLGSLAAVSSLFTFSRENERDADRAGVDLMEKAGYDVAQAALIWKNLRDEISVGANKDALDKLPIWQTHPGIVERIGTLTDMANARKKQDFTGEARWFETIAPFRMAWIQDELSRSQHEESITLFSRLLKLNRAQPEIHYAKGEALRNRSGAGDLDLAITEFRAAIALTGEPPVTHRGLGLSMRSQGNKDAAIASLTNYLQMAPTAPDHDLIQTYIGELKA